MGVTRAELNRIAEEQERLMLSAFLSVIEDIRDNATVSEIARLLTLGDIEGVIRLLALDEATWSPVIEQARQAYIVGGTTGAAQIGAIPAAAVAVSEATRPTIVFRFNPRNPRAEQYLANQSSRMIVELVESQRAMVRESLAVRLAEGMNPRQSALDLIGRVNRATGRREGGFIGLTSQQDGWIRTARAELESLDPNYLNRKLRSPKFDPIIKRAIKTGTPLKRAEIDSMITAMQARTERYRGQVIARTESINALRAGQEQAIDQAVSAAEVGPNEISRKWDATGDSRTRPDHIEMEGQKRGYKEPFKAPDGSLLLYPGDSSLGASKSQTIQCRCRAVTRIDFAGRLARIEGFA